jgi:hypothetical protein
MPGKGVWRELNYRLTFQRYQERNKMKEFSQETRRRMSESAKRRCTAEWKAARSKRLSTPLDLDKLRRMYASGHTQCEIAEAMGVTQKVIWGCMRRNEIASRKAAKRHQTGGDNHMWKGSAAKYAALHLRVETVRGKPQRCEECGTTDPHKAYDWANLTKKYDDVWDYKRMCRSCHLRMDGIIRNIKHMRKEVAQCQSAS